MLQGDHATLLEWPRAKPKAKSVCEIQTVSCSQGCEQRKNEAGIQGTLQVCACQGADTLLGNQGLAVKEVGQCRFSPPLTCKLETSYFAEVDT